MAAVHDKKPLSRRVNAVVMAHIPRNENLGAKRGILEYVTIGERRKGYAAGATFLQIAQEYQSQYEDDILLVSVNGKLMELHKTVDEDCRVEFITARHKPGMQAYQRSAKLIMLKAFYDISSFLPAKEAHP